MNKKPGAAKSAARKAALKPAKKAKKPADEQVTIRAPRWNELNPERRVSISKAALLSMGIAPRVGIVTALKTRPKRMREFRRRELAFEAAHRAGEFPGDTGLPRTVPIQRSLEFAMSSGWMVPKNAINALDRMHRETGSRLTKEQGDPPLSLVREADQSQRLPSVTVETAEVGKSNATSSSWVQPLSSSAPPPPRNEELLHLIIGALTIITASLAKEAKHNRLLKGDAVLNRSALVARISALFGAENVTYQGRTARNLDHLLKDCLKLFPNGFKHKLDEGE